MDTILAIFLAAALSAGDAQQSAAGPTENCEYYVNGAAQQGLLICEGWADDGVRHSSPQQNPPIEYGSGAIPRTYSSQNAAGR